ncbi:unnamed protein product [Caenorhabditis nigoni]
MSKQLSNCHSFYMDRLGNMQNIHLNNSTSSYSNSSTSRKQILTLKPSKNQYSLQQFHDVKVRFMDFGPNIDF